jgi:hypothetical protein
MISRLRREKLETKVFTYLGMIEARPVSPGGCDPWFIFDESRPKAFDIYAGFAFEKNSFPMR